MVRLLSFALAVTSFTSFASAQQAGVPPQNAPKSVQTAPAPAATNRKPPQPLKDEAPGGGPDKVWVNLKTSKYHCPGDRYYGRTGSGRYMTEAAAKAAGGKGPRGKNCFSK